MSTKKKHENEAMKATITVGPQLVIPQGMSYDDVIEAVRAKRDDENRTVQIDEPIEAWLFEGWWVTLAVLRQEYGLALKFTRDYPQKIETAPNTKENVPFGPFRVIGHYGDADFYPSVNRSDGKVQLSLEVRLANKFRPQFDALMAKIKATIKGGGLYRGKALQLKLPEPDEKVTFEHAPRFLDLSVGVDEDAIFTPTLADAIDVSVFTPVRHTETCKSLGIPLKQGVLLCGLPGTGKTLTGRMLARECVKNNWTFIMITDASRLAEGIRVARMFAPRVVLFAEDIDLVMAGEARTTEMNEILLAMDGVEPAAEIMFVLTSNKPEALHPALVRGRRLDAILHYKAPDAETVERLVRRYTPTLEAGAKLAKVGTILAGLIPATIESICSRARMSAARHGAGTVVTAKDLETVATMARAEYDLVKPTPAKMEPMPAAVERIADALANLGQPMFTTKSIDTPRLSRLNNDGAPSPRRLRG